jgi:hypothetical protein
LLWVRFPPPPLAVKRGRASRSAGFHRARGGRGFPGRRVRGAKAPALEEHVATLRAVLYVYRGAHVDPAASVDGHPRHRPFASGRACPGRGSGSGSWARGCFSVGAGVGAWGSVDKLSPTAAVPASGAWASEAPGVLTDTGPEGRGTRCELHSSTEQAPAAARASPGFQARVRTRGLGRSGA